MNRRVIIAGLLASIAMAMVEMLYEGLFGVGFWSAPVFIAATLLRSLQTAALPVAFSLTPVALGLMGHMMNSVLLGMLFVLLFGARLSTRGASVMAGMAYALVVFFLMWFAVLPLIDPVMLHLNPYVFAFAHLVWGMTLGAFISRIAPARASSAFT
jgi:hypothetical protein